MTKIYHDRKIKGFNDWFSRRTFSDLEFRNCFFQSCFISISRNPQRRSIIRNVQFIDCEQVGCTLYSAIVEEVMVNGFKTQTLFQTWGTVYKHVTIKGRFGRLMISPVILPGVATLEQQTAFNKANALYYTSVDWALDIREAEFEEADLRGIAARYILRDPGTQFILTREKALEGKWKEVDLRGTYWKTAIEMFLRQGAQDELFVAPKRDPRYRFLLAGLWALRDKGVVY